MASSLNSAGKGKGLKGMLSPAESPTKSGNSKGAGTDVAASVQLTGPLGMLNGNNLAAQPEEIGDSSSVKVAVLVRPMLDFEKTKAAQDIIQVGGCKLMTVLQHGQKCYCFDGFLCAK